MEPRSLNLSRGRPVRFAAAPGIRLRVTPGRTPELPGATLRLELSARSREDDYLR